MTAQRAVAQMEIELETEAQNPRFYLGKANTPIPLERSTESDPWTASTRYALQADPVPFRLELGEAVGASWSLTIRWDGKEVYTTHGKVAAPDGKLSAEIHHGASTSAPAASKVVRPPIRLRNETAYHVFVAAREPGDAEFALQLPPWGEHIVRPEEADTLDLGPWTARSILRADPVQEQPDLIPLVLGGLGLGVFGVGFYAVMIWGIWELFGAPSEDYWTAALGIALIAMVVGPLVSVARTGHLGSVLKRGFSRLSFVPSLVSVGGMLLIAFGLPAVLMLVGEGCCSNTTPAQAASDTTQLAQLGAWIQAKLTASPTVFIGRLLQLLLIGTLSMLPALLYFIFDRRKLSGLRERFFRSVVQLDPDLRTLEDARSVHGSRVDEVLGPGAAHESVPRIQFSRQFMILVATLVITIGWIIAIDPLGTVARLSTDLRLHHFIVPQRNALVFAFLGGYAFAIAMLFRRYVRSDLKPEAFAQIVVRIVTAVLLTWALTELPLMNAQPSGEPTATAQPGQEGGGVAETSSERTPHGFLLALVFLVGFFPETGLTIIRDAVQKRLSSRLPTVEESRPLDLLDGINLYHRTRLMDEGVDNLENLAHADIVDLMLGTRIPLETLLDWIDQSILLLHTGGDAAPTPLSVLRAHGIRTATDLERALQQAKERGEDQQFVTILGSEPNGPERLRVILDALGDDLWMAQLRRSRTNRTASKVIAPELLRYWDQGETAFLAQLSNWHFARRTSVEVEEPELANVQAVSNSTTLVAATSA